MIKISIQFFAIITLLASLGCSSVPTLSSPSAELSSQSSRYVYLEPIDDGGKSSGSHAVTICLPAGYSSTDRHYPVFYVLDGEGAFLTRQNGMRNTIAYELAHDQLVHDGLIQPVIFVAIHNSLDSNGDMIKGNRYMDYCPPGQVPDRKPDRQVKSEGYYQYLVNTIKPMIDENFRTQPDPETTGIAGFSAGGIGAFWMTYLHPETFGMGLCQSPAFLPSYIPKELQALLDNKDHPIPPVRLWIDAGSLEYDFIYKDAFAAYGKLIAQGFSSNENLAFLTGHNHGHEKFDCNRRMRSALYFLLRENTPRLTGVEINEMNSDVTGPIKLARRGRLILETVYDNWFRLTEYAPEFKIADPAIAVLSETTSLITPKTPGQTTISSIFGGREITEELEVIAPTAQQSCKVALNRVAVDGDLSDWLELPFLVDKPQKEGDVSAWSGPSDLSYRFGSMYDEQFFYVAIQTTDDTINSVPVTPPWVQDGVEARIDARPESERLFGEGKNEFQEILLVAISPSLKGEAARSAFDSPKLPEGTKAVCVATATGHNTEIAIPISYLNAKAGENWSAVRLNIVVNDFDGEYRGFSGDRLWWQPDWRYSDNTWGSGTFFKQEAK